MRPSLTLLVSSWLAELFVTVAISRILFFLVRAFFFFHQKKHFTRSSQPHWDLGVRQSLVSNGTRPPPLFLSIQARSSSSYSLQSRHSDEPRLFDPVDAFPASIEVEVKPELTDGEINDIVGKLRQLPAVDDVETYQAWTERLSRLVKGGVTAAALLAFVVFASVLAVVGSTIRLALQRRRTEVEVLKLVGASDRFIKGPFLVEGSTQGALGATGAVGILAALFFVVRGRLDAELAGLVGIEPSFLPWYVILGMIAVGIILGTLAALLGLRRLVTV